MAEVGKHGDALPPASPLGRTRPEAGRQRSLGSVICRVLAPRKTGEQRAGWSGELTNDWHLPGSSSDNWGDE